MRVAQADAGSTERLETRTKHADQALGRLEERERVDARVDRHVSIRLRVGLAVSSGSPPRGSGKLTLVIVEKNVTCSVPVDAMLTMK